ncbi:MAG: ATP-dependent helicase, partial [bacterium]|nr:ATP-dependent helicase [bacterium]
LGAVARDVLTLGGTPIELIDDVDAAALFAHAATPLFALEWDEVTAGEIDPEVPGLRSPERFLESAFRLIRKLRGALISPETFLERSIVGAAEFYAKPPNFAHPDLLYATKDAYRDSLAVAPAELQRQYAREVDLARILARLYAYYVELVGERARMTARDAIAEATELLQHDEELLEELRARYRFALLDDAQEATLGERALLETLFPKLAGVTLAGDARSATSTFRGARPDAVFKGVARTIELAHPHRIAHKPPIALFRAKDEAEEARTIAERVRERIASGTPAHEIALIFRSVGDVHRYEEALLNAGIAVAVAGDLNIFADARALDAIALLWSLWDPFRHDWLLRVLSGRALNLSDATLARLCSEPADAQTALFALDDAEATSRSGRWDPRRDVRLGWNVLFGEQDAHLSDTARERLTNFREMRARWVAQLAHAPLGELIRMVWSDALAMDGAPDSARARSQQLILRRLYERLTGYAAQRPHATLGDVLHYAQTRTASDLESCEPDANDGFVHLLSIDAARGREFSYVVVPDARAGSFPRWYVPDAFLFSPALGMIPKENVGDAKASRTAKFSYYLYRAKTRDAYNAEERRAFEYALARARGEVLVSASGRATRGMTAPEFLEELRAP